MSRECMECKCYHCINVCVCTVCRRSSDDPSVKERLDMSIDTCEDFEHLPILPPGNGILDEKKDTIR